MEYIVQVNDYDYKVKIEKEDNWYVAKWDKVASQGKTQEEALTNIKEALELYLEDNANER